MSKRLFAAALVLMLLVPSLARAGFSESSRVYDPALAQQALQIAELGYMPAIQEAVLNVDGFSRVGDFNFDRPAGDTRHIASYSVYDKALDEGGTAVVIAVRATGSGEWPLNLDLMPSGDYDLPYAENFMLAAQAVLSDQAAYLDGLSSPIFLVTGFSRGAAVANILGALLTDRYGADSVYAYTFATPRTVRGERPAYDNIFNVINPADLITFLPLPQWGFARYGTDLLLPVDDAALLPAAKAAYEARSDTSGPFFMAPNGSAAAQALADAMAGLIPSLSEDFGVRHALGHTGAAEEGEDGMTASEFLLLLFDGKLSPSSVYVKRLTAAANDFSPLLALLQETEGANSFGAAHSPAIYGAWMTAGLQ